MTKNIVAKIDLILHATEDFQKVSEPLNELLGIEKEEIVKEFRGQSSEFSNNGEFSRFNFIYCFLFQIILSLVLSLIKNPKKLWLMSKVQIKFICSVLLTTNKTQSG